MQYLPPPFGYPSGLSVTITGPSENAKSIAEACRAFGCPPPTCKKVEAAIRGSQRYDCQVMTCIAHQFDAVVELLGQFGGTIEARPAESSEYLIDYQRRDRISLSNLRRTKEGYRIAN